MITDNKELFIKYLKKLNFTTSQLENILCLTENHYDEINVDVLHEKIKYLVKLNLDKRLLRIIIEENPEFIFEDINIIKENITDIKNYNTKNIIEIVPQVLTLPEKQIKNMLEILKLLGFSEIEIKELLDSYPRILLYKPSFLGKKIQFIKNKVEFKNIKSIIKYYPYVFELEDNEIDNFINNL